MSSPVRFEDAPATRSEPPTLTPRSTAVLVCVPYTLLTVTWAFGRIEPLHTDAYRDITLNFTTIYLGVSGALLAIAGWRRHTGRSLRTPDT